MGEIGISRREFLYEIKGWEAKSIRRGYTKRGVLQLQLHRLQLWATMFSTGMTDKCNVNDFLPLYFDKEESNAPCSEEDRDELLQDIANENARLAKA